MKYLRSGRCESMTVPENIAKCGCDCNQCPTFRKNLSTEEERRICSEGWKRCLGIRLSPEKLRKCDGCSIPDAERSIYYLNCRVRKCAMVNGMENCARCMGFPCEELQEVHSLQKIKDHRDFMEKTGKEISVHDYMLFVQPYTGINHLNKIRKELSEKDLMDFKKHSLNVKFSDLTHPGDKSPAIRTIHSLLIGIYAEKNISFARLQTLQKKREQVLRILWTIGCHGTLEESATRLELDSTTYTDRKLLSKYDTLRKYFYDLNQYGMYCEVIPMSGQRWLTPSGALRKEGWTICLGFGDSLHGSEILRIFKEYVSRLEREYGKKAFWFFNRADLGVMLS